MDVAETSSVEQAFVEIDRLLAGRHLDAIVHAAGVAKPNAVEVASVADFAEVLNTNTLGTLRVLKCAIPRLRQSGGRVVLLTSLWGEVSGAMVGSYSASKHAIEAIADATRRETRGMGFEIIVVQPGVVRTEMLSSQTDVCMAQAANMSFEQKSLYGSLYERYVDLCASSQRLAIDAAKCATTIERALTDRWPRLRYRVGVDSKIICFLGWLLPARWMDLLMGFTLNRKPLSRSRHIRPV
jgi:NAD(P)-dependent dehydrogenase (short-subunit alcohol dehydrogenase family)